MPTIIGDISHSNYHRIQGIQPHWASETHIGYMVLLGLKPLLRASICETSQAGLQGNWYLPHFVFKSYLPSWSKTIRQEKKDNLSK